MKAARLPTCRAFLLSASISVALVFVILESRFSNDKYTASKQTLQRWGTVQNREFADIFNETLGFQEIFTINLPTRADKRDALALMSELTGFRITWVDGVDGHTIPNKGLPFGWDRTHMPESNLGSWRGHINAIRRVVEEGHASALIMEDDMDWDVHLKTQLAQFAAAAIELQEGRSQDQGQGQGQYPPLPLPHLRRPLHQGLKDSPPPPPPTSLQYQSRPPPNGKTESNDTNSDDDNDDDDEPGGGGGGGGRSTTSSISPYGQHWDLLWLGSCATNRQRDLPDFMQIPDSLRDDREVVLRHDPTVAPLRHRVGNGSFRWEEYDDNDDNGDDGDDGDGDEEGGGGDVDGDGGEDGGGVGKGGGKRGGRGGTRVVYIPGDNICSFAYALSRTGARKALEFLSVRGVAGRPFDNQLSDLCRTRADGMRCLAVVPSLFVHHRPRGRVAGDSDINGGGGGGSDGDGDDDDDDEGQVREKGFTENIVYSVRLNLENLVQGLEPERQWED